MAWLFSPSRSQLCEGRTECSWQKVALRLVGSRNRRAEWQVLEGAAVRAGVSGSGPYRAWEVVTGT